MIIELIVGVREKRGIPIVRKRKKRTILFFFVSYFEVSSVMSSSSSQTTSSLQRSTELVDLPTVNTNPPSFAPLHRTTELENLHDYVNNDDDKRTSSTTKKILTKCMTVIGDGSDKQI